MTTLQDIFLDLSHGEFSQLELGDFATRDPDTEPDPRSYMQLIRSVNLGLTAIYTEFFLKSADMYIDLDEAIDTYKLDYRWAVSNVASLESPKYISDTVANPWPDNLLKIEAIFDEAGEELKLNDIDEPLSIFTPSYNEIQVPWPNDFNTLTVQYRANHPKIVYAAGMDPSTTYLEIPEPLREALLYYVAARVFAGVDMQRPESNGYWSKYITKVQDAHRQGMYTQPEQDNERFAASGWR